MAGLSSCGALLSSLHLSFGCTRNICNIDCCNDGNDDGNNTINHNIEATTNPTKHRVLNSKTYTGPFISMFKFASQTHIAVLTASVSNIAINKEVNRLATSKNTSSFSIDDTALSETNQENELKKQLTSVFESLSSTHEASKLATTQIEETNIQMKKCLDVVESVRNTTDNINSLLKNFPENIAHTSNPTTEQYIQDANSAIPAIRALFNDTTSISSEHEVATNSPTMRLSRADSNQSAIDAPKINHTEKIKTATIESFKDVMLRIAIIEALSKKDNSIDATYGNTSYDSTDGASYDATDGAGYDATDGAGYDVTDGPSLPSWLNTTGLITTLVSPMIAPILTTMGVIPAEDKTPNLSISIEENEASIRCCNKTRDNPARIIINQPSFDTMTTNLSIVNSENYVKPKEPLLVGVVRLVEGKWDVFPIGFLSSTHRQDLANNVSLEVIPGYTLVSYKIGGYKISCHAEHALRNTFEHMEIKQPLLLDKDRNISFYAMNTEYRKLVSENGEDILNMLHRPMPNDEDHVSVSADVSDGNELNERATIL